MRSSALVTVVVLLFIAITSTQAATEIQISQLQGLPDSTPFRLITSVASSGNGYLVAWGATTTSNSTVYFDPPMTIYVRVLGADGAPAQPSAIALGKGQQPAVTWNGHEYLVVWGNTSPTTGLLPTPSAVGVRVREDGSLIDPQPVTLVSEVNPFSYLSTVVWSGSQYLVTWNRGMALVDAGLHSSRLISLPAIGTVPLYSASSGGGFLAITAALISGKQRLFIVPISSTGDVGDAIPLNGPHAGAVGVDGGYALIWDDTSNLRYARLRPDGTMLSTSIAVPGHVEFPHIAARDGRIVAAWEKIPSASPSIVCTVRLDTTVQPVCSAGRQHDPAIALSSTSVLLAWSDHATNSDNMRVAVTPSFDLPRADSAGRSLSDVQSTPVAERRSDGATTVAWSAFDVLTKRPLVHLGGMNSKGVKLADRFAFDTALDQGTPAISSGVGRTMILWPEGPPESSKIRMTIFDDSTEALIATLPIATGSAPSAAFDGQEWLVSWQSPAGVIQFAIINRDGNAMASGSMPATSGIQSAPAVAWSGKVFFVVWRESVVPLPGVPAIDRIQAVTISVAGVQSSALTLDFADAGRLTAPSVGRNGDRVLASWGRFNTLREALFDAGGKQIGRFIDFAWPVAFARTSTRAMAGGFATLAGSQVALTSSEGLALDTIDVAFIGDNGDLVIDPANRFTFVYSRAVGGSNTATFAQTIGLPRRRAGTR